MNTKLSVDEIMLAIWNSGLWNKRTDVFVPNLSWGLLNHEADLAIMSKSGYLTEVEIKRSWEDFKADFKKDHGHKDELVYYFYYCVPESIKDRVIEFLDEKFGHGRPPVICYTENAIIYGCKGGCARTGYGRKMFIEERLKFATLGCMRIWPLKQELVEDYRK